MKFTTKDGEEMEYLPPWNTPVPAGDELDIEIAKLGMALEALAVIATQRQLVGEEIEVIEFAASTMGPQDGPRIERPGGSGRIITLG